MLIDGVLSDGVASDGACWLWLCDLWKEGKGRAGEYLVGGSGRAEREEEGGKRKSITAWARGKARGEEREREGLKRKG